MLASAQIEDSDLVAKQVLLEAVPAKVGNISCQMATLPTVDISGPCDKGYIIQELENVEAGITIQSAGIASQGSSWQMPPRSVSSILTLVGSSTLADGCSVCVALTRAFPQDRRPPSYKRKLMVVRKRTSILLFTYKEAKLIYLSSETKRRRLEHASDVFRDKRLRLGNPTAAKPTVVVSVSTFGESSTSNTSEAEMRDDTDKREALKVCTVLHPHRHS
jgi:hypothetical protein